MSYRFLTHLTLTATLVAALGAAPAAAQQKGKSGEKGKQTEATKAQAKRPELQRRLREEQVRESESRRREEDRNESYDRDRDYEDDYRYESNGRRKGVPAGWCIGKGNPHNTPENCGPNAGRSTYSRSGRSGSYEDRHAEFHRYLDRKYSDLADDRPLDPVHQIRIRRDRAAEHERFHRESGRRHD